MGARRSWNSLLLVENNVRCNGWSSGTDVALEFALVVVELVVVVEAVVGMVVADCEKDKLDVARL